ncbi:MAG TPA: MFS transporter, partial [Streptosporangiaceae bacterium]|nr:MFS transporter [Streptosporangiaceae bacterium]
GGRMADVYGRRRVFLSGLTLFTISSLVAGLAGSGGLLIGSRAIQGVGAALLMPTTLAIIMAAFRTPRERNSAIGIWTAIGALALGLGPVVGGLISEHLHWGWIFLINVPVGIITFAIALRSVRESRADLTSRQLDMAGLTTSALALFALTYALIEGSDRGWTSTPIVAAFAIAAAGLAAFLVIEARAKQPMMDLSTFRIRQFSGGSATMMIWAFGILGIYFFTSLYLQGVLGFSPVKAGLSFVPMALSLVVAAGVAPRLEARIGTHRAVALGMLMMAVALVLILPLGATAGFGSFMPGFVVFGFGAGFMNVPLTNGILHAIPQERAGVVSALLNNSREVAGLLGITVIGAVLRAAQAHSLRGGATPAHAFLYGYHTGLYVTIGLLAAGVLVSYLTLRSRTGADRTGPDRTAPDRTGPGRIGAGV